MEEKEKGNKKEKKKLNIKEIGIERLVIMLLAGIFIVILSVPGLFSSSSNQKKGSSNNNGSNPIVNQQVQDTDEATNYTDQLEKRLTQVLKKVEGLGEVEVMITLKASKELVPLKDSPYSQDAVNEVDGDGGSRISSKVTNNEESVLINSEEGDNVPYIIKEIEPTIEGVVVIAHGGKDPVIVAEIIDAVEVLFDVPPHKIKVMKMNSR